MPSVQIKDVPERTWSTLRDRAADSGQSLQAYLRAWLIRQAEAPTVDEILSRADRRRGGNFTAQQAADALRAERARR